MMVSAVMDVVRGGYYKRRKMTDLQWRWNNFAKRKEAMSRHEPIISQMLHTHNLETVCTDCGAIATTAIDYVACVVCGGSTVSPYYC